MVVMIIYNQSKRQTKGKDAVSERDNIMVLFVVDSTRTDRQVDVSTEHYNHTGFAQGSYPRSSTLSIVIDGMDDDHEPLESAALVSNSDEKDMTRSLLASEDSDDDLYQSVKSDTEDDYVS